VFCRGWRPPAGLTFILPTLLLYHRLCTFVKYPLGALCVSGNSTYVAESTAFKAGTCPLLGRCLADIQPVLAGARGRTQPRTSSLHTNTGGKKNILLPPARPAS